MLTEEPFKPSVALSVVVEVPDGDERGVKDLAGFFDGDTTGFVGVVVTDGDDDNEGCVEGDEESSFAVSPLWFAFITTSQSDDFVSPSPGLKSFIVSLPGPQSK